MAAAAGPGGVAALALDVSDGAVAAARLADVQLAARRLEAARVHLVGVVERSGQWAVEGALSPAAHLRRVLGVEHRDAKSDLRAARELADLPALAAAFAAGRVPRAAVDRIVAAGTRTAARREALPAFEAVFADVAATQPAGVLARALAMWGEQIDPLAAIVDEADAAHRRRLDLVPLADGWHIEGFLTFEQGAAVAAALNAIAARTRRTPATGGGHSGDHAESAGTGDSGFDASDLLAGLTPAQARADALADLARLVAACGDLPATGGLRPTMIVTVPLARLEHDPEEPFPTNPPHPSPRQHPAAPADPADPAGSAGRAAEAHPAASAGPAEEARPERAFTDAGATWAVSNGPGGGTLSAHAAARIACDSEVHRIVLSPAGLPLDIGRKTRSVPTHIRLALNQRDSGCAHPECDRPPAWTEAHHITPWQHGGPTSLDNLSRDFWVRWHHEREANQQRQGQGCGDLLPDQLRPARGKRRG